ncbi:18127_t:CDS:2, partial [Entrophospora sp. SA101]
ILLTNPTISASLELFEGLQILQHRGQDAAGIITCGNKGRLYQCKGNGMVRDVFNHEVLLHLGGSLGVGHVRYPTAGTSSRSEAQPFYVNSPYGIVFAHVPDTSRVAALQVSHKLNIAYREGFIKNRYVGRTFIMPGQQMRRKNVRRKLNAMALEFTDKNVLIVDDSIVRGTTSKEIVQMARDAGAKKVYFASCAPPIRYPNVYGIDMPSRKELVAHDRDNEKIAQEIGADKVIYQELDDLIESCRKFNQNILNFDCSVFNGHYTTGGVTEEYLEHLENARGDSTKDNVSNGIYYEQDTIIGLGSLNKYIT